MRIIWQAGLGLGLIALAGCAELGLGSKPAAVAPEVTPAASAPVPAEGANTAEALDTTTEAERTAALAEPAPAAETELGQTLLNARGRKLWLAGRAKRDDWGSRPAAELHLEDAAWAD